MRSLFIFITVIVLSSMQSYAQVVVGGVVRDSTTMEPIAGVIASVINNQGKTIVYEVTGRSGEYSLRVNTSGKSITLAFQHFSYDEYNKTIENSSANIDVDLQLKSIQEEEDVDKNLDVTYNLIE